MFTKVLKSFTDCFLQPVEAGKTASSFASASEAATSLDISVGLSAVKASEVESLLIYQGFFNEKLIGCEDHFAQPPV